MSHTYAISHCYLLTFNAGFLKGIDDLAQPDVRGFKLFPQTLPTPTKFHSFMPASNMETWL